MPQNGIIYRILIASPSDCLKERSSIPDIIHSWNSAHSFHTGVIIEPVMWESHVIPELGGRPQEIINKQIVDSCDFLIGAFWTRLGTATGDHASGTAEEIDRLRKQGKKTLLYFSAIPVIPDSIDIEQYKALRAYKENIRDEGIVFEYSGMPEFREMLHKHLSALMAEVTKTSVSEQSSPEKSVVEIFSNQFLSFLRRLQADWESERDSEPYSIDDAKFILSSAVSNLLDFRAQIISDPTNDLIPTIENTVKAMKALQRHQIYIDGGKSFKEFWVKGDEAICALNKIVEVLAE